MLFVSLLVFELAPSEILWENQNMINIKVLVS